MRKIEIDAKKEGTKVMITLDEESAGFLLSYLEDMADTQESDTSYFVMQELREVGVASIRDEDFEE